MKPSTKKNLLSSVILTAGFVLMLIAVPTLAQGSSTKLVVFSAIATGITLFLSSRVWASGSDDSDDSSGNA